MKEITVEATLNNTEEVTAFVDEQLEALDCSVKTQMQLDIIVDELFGNIARYAYSPNTGMATVRFETEDDPMKAVITFIDEGKPFNPLDSPEPDVTLSAQERNIGGLGIFMVRKMTDDILYEYENGRNILRIKKRVI